MTLYKGYNDCEWRYNGISTGLFYRDETFPKWDYCPHYYFDVKNECFTSSAPPRGPHPLTKIGKTSVYHYNPRQLYFHIGEDGEVEFFKISDGVPFTSAKYYGGYRIYLTNRDGSLSLVGYPCGFPLETPTAKTVRPIHEFRRMPIIPKIDHIMFSSQDKWLIERMGKRT